MIAKIKRTIEKFVNTIQLLFYEIEILFLF